MRSVCLAYKPYAGIRTKFLCMLKNKFLPQRMPACCRRTFFERIQPMSNVHLPFVSVYQRMTDFVHTLAYASAIRNSVTGLLEIGKIGDLNSLKKHSKGNLWYYQQVCKISKRSVKKCSCIVKFKTTCKNAIPV